MNFRRLVLSLLAILTSAVLVVAVDPAPPARAQASEEQAFVNAINNLRASKGLSRLSVDPELVAASRIWAQNMANAGGISHAPDITAGITQQWLKVGENVGVGPDVNVLMDAFIASPTHYDNLIDPSYNRVGVGVVWKGNVMFTTHRFMNVAAAPTTTRPTTTTTRPTTTTRRPTTTTTVRPTTTTRRITTTTRPTTTTTRPTTTTTRRPTTTTTTRQATTTWVTTTTSTTRPTTTTSQTTPPQTSPTQTSPTSTTVAPDTSTTSRGPTVTTARPAATPTTSGGRTPATTTSAPSPSASSTSTTADPPALLPSERPAQPASPAASPTLDRMDVLLNALVDVGS